MFFKRDRLKPVSFNLDFNLLFLILTGILVYCLSIKNVFIWDDLVLVVDNPFVKDLFNLKTIFGTSLSEHVGSIPNMPNMYYRPLQTALFNIEYHIFGLNASFYHIVNVLLQITSAILVYLLFLKLSITRVISFLIALIFLVHPAFSPIVCYISGCADSLAFIFFLGALIIYIDFRQRNDIRRLLVSSVLFLAGLLSKEIILAGILILALYDILFYPQRNSLKKTIFRCTPFLLAVLIYFIMRLGVTSNTSINWNIRNGVFGFGCYVWEYLKILFFNFRLSLDADYKISQSIFKSIFVIACFIGTLVWYKKYIKKDYKLILFLALWFLIFISPVCNFFKLPVSISGHWVYIASVGFIGCLIVTASNLAKSKKILTYTGVTLYGVFLIVFCYVSVCNSILWVNPVKFYKNIIKYNPNTPNPYVNIAKIYFDQKKIDQAVKYLNTALKISPYNLWANALMGDCELSKKEYTKAIMYYRKAIDISPDFSGGYLGIGIVHYENANKKMALYYFRKSTKVNKYESMGYYNSAFVYADWGDFRKSVKLLKTAISLNPDNKMFYKKLGNIYWKLQNKNGVKFAAENLLRLDPSDKEAKEILAVVNKK